MAVGCRLFEKEENQAMVNGQYAVFDYLLGRNQSSSELVASGVR
jgi:hypothetical protein